MAGLVGSLAGASIMAITAHGGRVNSLEDMLYQWHEGFLL